MARVRSGVARHRRRKRLLNKAKGFWGARRRHYKCAKQTLIKAEVYATRDRRVHRREMRQLWITRISAACQQRGITYSRFIHGLGCASVGLDRKQLSELAIRNPEAFDRLVEAARGALAS